MRDSFRFPKLHILIPIEANKATSDQWIIPLATPMIPISRIPHPNHLNGSQSGPLMLMFIYNKTAIRKKGIDKMRNRYFILSILERVVNGQNIHRPERLGTYYLLWANTFLLFHNLDKLGFLVYLQEHIFLPYRNSYSCLRRHYHKYPHLLFEGYKQIWFEGKNRSYYYNSLRSILKEIRAKLQLLISYSNNKHDISRCQDGGLQWEY